MYQSSNQFENSQKVWMINDILKYLCESFVHWQKFKLQQDYLPAVYKKLLTERGTNSKGCFFYRICYIIKTLKCTYLLVFICI